MKLDNTKIFIQSIKHDNKRVLLVALLSLFYAVFGGVSIGTIIPLLQSTENKSSSTDGIWDISGKKYQCRVAYDFILKLHTDLFENVMKPDIRYFSDTKTN